MPGIIDLQTNLRDLPYSTDNKQPYIRTRIPSYDDPGPKALLGKDVIGRNGQIGAALTDVERISKWGTDGLGGLLSVIKDNGLVRTNPKPIGPNFGLAGQRPKRLYNPISTLGQILVQGTGIHLNRQGLFPFFPKENTYENIVRNEYNGNEDTPNRLTYLRDTKLLGKSVNSQFADHLSVNRNEETILIEYGGGPGSVLGIGKTKIRRYDYTEEWATNNPNREGLKQILALTYNQLDAHSNEFSVRQLGTGIGAIRNFAQTIKEKSTASDQAKKRILGAVSNYSKFNRNKTYGTGDPGDSTALNRESYYRGKPKTGAGVKGIDLINLNRIYSSNQAKQGSGYDDIIKFYFAILDNDNPSNKVYTHFRAYLTNFSDNYSSEWQSFKYLGRAENFYRYSGFDRSISLNFQVHAGSRAELLPIYDKLNYLASIMAPDYSNGGFMRGNIVEITVGDYLNNVPGIIEKLDFSFPNESPWEIAKSPVEQSTPQSIPEGTSDPYSAELPTLIEVDMNFKPIHDFLPRTIKPTTVSDRANGNLNTLPESPFITLGSDNKGYKVTTEQLNALASVPANSPSPSTEDPIDPIADILDSLPNQDLFNFPGI